LRLEADATGPTVDAAVVSTLTGRGTLVGTPAYMAPEQLRGDSLDGRADQFSWGVVAYELLTGRLPFGAGRDAIGILADLLRREQPPIDNPEVPERPAPAVLPALSKSPDERFPHMDELVDVLSSLITGETQPGRAQTMSAATTRARGHDAITVEAAPRRRA